MHLMALATALAATVSAHAQAWQERDESEGVKLEARAVPAEHLEEFRVTTDAAPAPAVIARYLLAGFLDTTDASVTRTFVRRDADAATILDRFSSPGLSDRCYRMRFERSNGQAPGELKVRFESEDTAAEALPPDCVRMRSRGEWTLTPKGQGTRLTYVSFTDPGGSLPVFLVRRSLSKAVVENVKKVVAGARAP
jgi:hypothetical protein